MLSDLLHLLDSKFEWVYIYVSTVSSPEKVKGITRLDILKTIMHMNTEQRTHQKHLQNFCEKQ